MYNVYAIQLFRSVIFSPVSASYHYAVYFFICSNSNGGGDSLADLEGGGGRGGWHPPPLQISKIKEINKPKQKIGDNPLENEEERKSCMFV